MRLAALLDNAADRLEAWEALDPAASAVADAMRKLVPAGIVEDTASGTPTGHPAHPPLVALPIGAWTGATLLDLCGADADSAQFLVGIGTVSAIPAAYAGTSDWLTTSGAERRVGLTHATANLVAVGCQGASWWARRRGHRVKGAVLSGVGMAFATVGGWLGGHLAYALGVGVDTTAFQHLPTDWTDAMAESGVTENLTRCDAAGTPIVVFRTADRIVALADRCTHRGGPLHEGELADGCITCPWHGSVFDADGMVQSGPATRPQPALEVRTVDGRVQVRSQTQRALRTNPVWH